MVAVHTQGSSLRVVIIGAGIAGLAAAISLRKVGHRVLVLERGTRLTEAGAGIQIPANCARALDELGVLEQLRLLASKPPELVIRSFHGTEIGRQDYKPIEDQFGFPHLLVHRADLRQILFSEAIVRGTTIQFGARPVCVDTEQGFVQLEDSRCFTADIILGADGDRSWCRTQIDPQQKIGHTSGDLLYRLYMPLDKMRADPELATLVTAPSLHAWYGKDSHAVGYAIEARNMFNVVLTLPSFEGLPVNILTHHPSTVHKSYLKLACCTWDSRVRKLVDSASDEVVEWTLLKSPEVNSWVQKRLVLIGDAAQPLLPYLAQGAAQAIVSAVDLGRVLSSIGSQSEVDAALHRFEQKRRPKVAYVAETTNQMRLNVQQSQEKLIRTRNQELRCGGLGHDCPNIWADPAWQQRVWGEQPISFTPSTQDYAPWETLWERWSPRKGVDYSSVFLT